MELTETIRFKLWTIFFLTVVLSLAQTTVLAQKIEKTKIRSQDKDRTYYLFVPDKARSIAIFEPKLTDEVVERSEKI